MEFEPADYDWTDLKTKEGLTPERAKRYREVLAETNERIIAALKAHHGECTMQAMVLPTTLATGTRGDRRVYAPVVALFADRFPGYPRLATIAQAITNTSPVSHVIYCATHRIPSDVIGESQRAGLDVKVDEDGNSFTIGGLILERADCF